MGNKIVIVTGGSRGLGKNAALKLAQQGIDVILTFRSKESEALEVVREIEAGGARAAALQLDAGNSASFGAFAGQVKQLLAEKWQRSNFDFLVNNAGIGIHAPFAETTEAQFDELMNVHL